MNGALDHVEQLCDAALPVVALLDPPGRDQPGLAAGRTPIGSGA